MRTPHSLNNKTAVDDITPTVESSPTNDSMNIGDYGDKTLASESLGLEAALESVQGSNPQLQVHVYKEQAEKEKYRRMHCEKMIGKLQIKLLEVQQQVAVLQSTDRKKDLMIDQLDQVLAQVVQGWKQHEAENSTLLEELNQERLTAVNEAESLRNLLTKSEKNFHECNEQLEEEKRLGNLKVQNLQHRMTELDVSYSAAMQQLDSERSANSELKMKLKSSLEGQTKAELLILELEQILKKEEQGAAKRAHELNSQAQELGAAHARLEAEVKRREEAEISLARERDRWQGETEEHRLRSEALRAEKEKLKEELEQRVIGLESSRDQAFQSFQQQLETLQFKSSTREQQLLESHHEELIKLHRTLQGAERQIREGSSSRQRLEERLSSAERELEKLRQENGILQQSRRQILTGLQGFLGSHRSPGLQMYTNGAARSPDSVVASSGISMRSPKASRRSPTKTPTTPQLIDHNADFSSNSVSTPVRDFLVDYKQMTSSLLTGIQSAYPGPTSIGMEPFVARNRSVQLLNGGVEEHQAHGDTTPQLRHHRTTSRTKSGGGDTYRPSHADNTNNTSSLIGSSQDGSPSPVSRLDSRLVHYDRLDESSTSVQREEILKTYITKLLGRPPSKPLTADKENQPSGDVRRVSHDVSAKERISRSDVRVGRGLHDDVAVKGRGNLDDVRVGRDSYDDVNRGSNSSLDRLGLKSGVLTSRQRSRSVSGERSSRDVSVSNLRMVGAGSRQSVTSNSSRQKPFWR